MLGRYWRWQRAQMAEGGQFAPRIAMRGLVTMLLWDLAIPLGAYFAARAVGANTTVALLVSTVAAGIRMLYLIRKQGEVDGFSVLMLLVFGGGLALSWWTGDARFLLLKGSFVTILGGLVFVLSGAIRRPLAYEVAKRLAAGDAHSRRDLERGWRESGAFRLGMYLMTDVWGLGLVVEGAVQVGMILRCSIDVAVIGTTVVQVLTLALVGGWNVWFVEMSRALARRAQQEPAAVDRLG